MVVYGNRDEEKDKVSKEAILAGMVTTRLLMEIGMIIKFTLGVDYIKSAFMKADPLVETY